MASFDGNPVTSVKSASNTQTLNFTTTQTNDLIVLVAYSELNTGASPTISGVSGGSLTWTQRVRSNASTRGNMEVWWAVAPSALTATAITATYSANFDDATLCVFAINGANTTTPFDSNASLPAKQSFTASATPSFSGISTTGANTLALFAVATNSLWTPPGTVPTGYGSKATASNGGGTLFAEFALAVEAQSAALSSATIAWGSAIPGSNLGGEAILDAIALASPFIINAQVTQVGTEIWAPGLPAALITQVGTEIWAPGVPAVRATQAGLEVWASVTPATIDPLAGRVQAGAAIRAAMGVSIPIAGQVSAGARGLVNPSLAIPLSGRAQAGSTMRGSLAQLVSLNALMTASSAAQGAAVLTAPVTTRPFLWVAL